MSYVLHRPSPPLSAYIDNLYYLNSSASAPIVKVLPRPSLTLMVNFGDPFQIHPSDQRGTIIRCAESWWVGLWNRYHLVDWPQHTHVFGIHFKPGGTYPFLRFPVAELNNQVVALDAIWDNAAEIREQLYDAPSAAAGFALLEQLLLGRLEELPYGLDIVQYAISEIARQHGVLSIRSLSDHIGISQNHLGTLFKRMVGLPTKDLARFYRFDRVIRSIDPAQTADWTQLAHEALYYDQSHFNKDFLAFTGHTPGDYLRLRRQWYSDDPKHVELLQLLPTD